MAGAGDRALRLQLARRRDDAVRAAARRRDARRRDAVRAPGLGRGRVGRSSTGCSRAARTPSPTRRAAGDPPRPSAWSSATAAGTTRPRTATRHAPDRLRSIAQAAARVAAERDRGCLCADAARQRGRALVAFSGGETPWLMLRAAAVHGPAVGPDLTSRRSTSASRRAATQRRNLARLAADPGATRARCRRPNLLAMPVERRRPRRRGDATTSDCSRARRPAAALRPRAARSRRRRSHRLARAGRSGARGAGPRRGVTAATTRARAA